MTATAFFLQCRPYEPSTHELHASDQITIAATRWQELYSGHDGSARPLFVEVREPGDSGSGCVTGRLRPAVFGSTDTVEGDTILIPLWMWLQLGAPGEESWLQARVVGLPDAGSVTLRPRSVATLAELEGDPVALLAAELSGAGGGPSWACLNAGAELPLALGAFDVLRVADVGGREVRAACILNLDVTLELEPALNTPVVPREPSPELLTPPVVEPAPVAPPAPVPAQGGRYRPGFIPFSGTGYRLS
jgi:hypothetical protein